MLNVKYAVPDRDNPTRQSRDSDPPDTAAFCGIVHQRHTATIILHPGIIPT